MQALFKLTGIRFVKEELADLSFSAVYDPEDHEDDFVKAVPFGDLKIRIDKNEVINGFVGKVGKMFRFVISEAEEPLHPHNQEKGP